MYFFFNVEIYQEGFQPFQVPIILHTLIHLFKRQKQNMGAYIPFISTSQHDWKPNQTLLVATLNYGGILNSPFQFYSDIDQRQSQRTQKMSKIFKALLDNKSYFKKDKFKWQLGKIDKQVQTRYTPIYKKDAGIYEDKLVNQATFKKLWDQNWDKDPKVIQAKSYMEQKKKLQSQKDKNNAAVQSLQNKDKKQQKKFQFTQDEKNVAKQFDFLCYHAIVSCIYDTAQCKLSLDQILQKENDASKYKKLMEQYFSRAYLDQHKKIDKLMKGFVRNFYPKLTEDIKVTKNGQNKNNDSNKATNNESNGMIERIFKYDKFIDVMFFQQPTQRLINCLKYYPYHQHYLKYQKLIQQKKFEQFKKEYNKQEYQAKKKKIAAMKQPQKPSTRQEQQKQAQKQKQIMQKIYPKILDLQKSERRANKTLNTIMEGYSKQHKVRQELKSIRQYRIGRRNVISLGLDIEEKLKQIEKIREEYQPYQKQLQNQKSKNKDFQLDVYGDEKTGIIAVRKQRFKKIQSIWKFYSPKRIQQILQHRKNQDKQYQQQLEIKYENWPVVKGRQQTATIVCDNYIFINIHLSSKPEKNKPQVILMKDTLNMLAGIRDNQKAYEVVIGGDTNSYVNNDDLEDFYIFPKYQHHFTTNKKRTFLQPQFDKSEKMVTQCKDHLISTLPMITRGRTQINLQGLVTKQKLLPTTIHPFDHFLVLCLLKGEKND